MVITQDIQNGRGRTTCLSKIRMKSLPWLFRCDSRNNHEKRDCDATLARRLVKRFHRHPWARRLRPSDDADIVEGLSTDSSRCK